MPALLDDKPPRATLPSAPAGPEQDGMPAGPEQGTLAGPEQGVIEDARRRQRSRWLRATLAALCVLAGAGILLAATTGGATPGEAPLHLSPEPSPLSTRHAGRGSRSIAVSLSPNLEGGQAGWCVTILEASGVGGGTCGPLPTFAHPLLAGSSGWSRGDRDITTTEIVAPRVAYFLVNHSRRVATKRLPEIPYGLRVAIVHTPLPHSAGRVAIHAGLPTLVPLDARGKPIAESRDYGAVWFRDGIAPPPHSKDPAG